MENTALNIDSLDDFTRAYMEAALFSSTYMVDEISVTETHYDETHDITDFTPEAWKKCVDDCAEFQKINAGLLERAYIFDKQAIDIDGKRRFPDTDYNESKAGHDFWLTRNGHGAGFWDRGLQDIGAELSNKCGFKTQFQSLDLYLDENGKIGIE